MRRLHFKPAPQLLGFFFFETNTFDLFQTLNNKNLYKTYFTMRFNVTRWPQKNIIIADGTWSAIKKI